MTYDGSPDAIAKRHAQNAWEERWMPWIVGCVKVAMFIVLALSFAGGCPPGVCGY